MMRFLAAALLALPVWAAPSLDDGYGQMYNLDFASAHRTFAGYERLHPGDPMGPVSDAAAYLFSELDRLHILQSEFFVHDQHFITDHKLAPDPDVRRRFDDWRWRRAGSWRNRRRKARTRCSPRCCDSGCTPTTWR